MWGLVRAQGAALRAGAKSGVEMLWKLDLINMAIMSQGFVSGVGELHI